MHDKKVGKCQDCKHAVDIGQQIYCDMNQCHTKMMACGDALYANRLKYVFEVDKNECCNQWESKQ